MTARILLQSKKSLEISHNPRGRGFQSVCFGAFFFCRMCKVLVGLATCPGVITHWDNGEKECYTYGDTSKRETLQTSVGQKRIIERKKSSDTVLGPLKKGAGLFCSPDVEQKPGHLGEGRTDPERTWPQADLCESSQMSKAAHCFLKWEAWLYPLLFASPLYECFHEDRWQELLGERSPNFDV